MKDGVLMIIHIYAKVSNRSATLMGWVIQFKNRYFLTIGYIYPSTKVVNATHMTNQWIVCLATKLYHKRPLHK